MTHSCTDEDLLGALRAFAAENDRPLMTTEANDPDREVLPAE